MWKELCSQDYVLVCTGFLDHCIYISLQGRNVYHILVKIWNSHVGKDEYGLTFTELLNCIRIRLSQYWMWADYRWWLLTSWFSKVPSLDVKKSHLGTCSVVKTHTSLMGSFGALLAWLRYQPAQLSARVHLLFTKMYFLSLWVDALRKKAMLWLSHYPHGTAVFIGA